MPAVQDAKDYKMLQGYKGPQRPTTKTYPSEKPKKNSRHLETTIINLYRTCSVGKAIGAQLLTNKRKKKLQVDGVHLPYILIRRYFTQKMKVAAISL